MAVKLKGQVGAKNKHVMNTHCIRIAFAFLIKHRTRYSVSSHNLESDANTTSKKQQHYR